MNDTYISLISDLLQLNKSDVRATISLLDDGCTIPFISRYRKEQTGALDEVQVAAIEEQLLRLRELTQRKQTILKTIDEQERLTNELKQRIDECWDSTTLEDIYLPYKPKRRTRAAIARQRGLEPLAKRVMSQRETDIRRTAESFSGTDEVKTTDDALQGARDIIAEWVNEHAVARTIVREVFGSTARLEAKVVKGKDEEGRYRDYYDFSESLSRCASHRLLAVRRAEAEGALRVGITPDADRALSRLHRLFVKGRNEASSQVEEAVDDAYKRLLKSSVETEFAAQSKLRADTEAIRVFSENLRQLLLAAPLGQKRVMGIDPGFRTGCKIVCLNAQGALLHNETIYPHPPQRDQKKAAAKIAQLVQSYQIEAIAVGNGTASRETEQFLSTVHFDRKVQIFIVSESGASIYSASKLAREEFPDYDVTVRGAVSIARRLMDPLAELVKIDPKSIGVGQYQHDVDQTILKRSLDQTVEHCVNRVGVNLNTASHHLLTYVSGVGSTVAKRIVDYRTEHGAFKSRHELLKVPRMGAKTFEQCAGFLRVTNGAHPLDNSAVHPESYAIVDRMAKDLGVNVKSLIGQKDLAQRVDLSRYISDKIGMPTLLDILNELEKPGLDPREQIKVFTFDPTVSKLEDLHEGQQLPGIVTNITNFGCFVDVGIKENGLIHISELADRFVSDPAQVVALHQQVSVRVIGVDLQRRRLQLSMRTSK